MRLSFCLVGCVVLGCGSTRTEHPAVGEAGAGSVAGASASSVAGAGGSVNAAGASGRADSNGGESGAGAEVGMAGASGASETERCLSDEQCDDENPCTVDHCDEHRECVSTAAKEGAECQSALCVPNGTCRVGRCEGTAITQQGGLVDTLFSFGTERNEAGALSGGMAAFMPGNKLVFADDLAVGTAFSVVDIEPDGLRVEAQVLSTVPLLRTQYDAWSWQSHWQNHLVPLSDKRFALYSAQDDLLIFEIDDRGVLGAVKRQQIPPEGLADAVATSGGHIWACGSQLKHLQVSAANEVQTLPAVSFPDGSPATCTRLTVAPDGDTLFASTKQGLVRWSASAEKPELELVVPGGVRGFALAGNAQYVSVQRAANFGSLGAVETYRVADASLLSTFQPTAEARPFGAELVGSQLVTIWDETSELAEGGKVQAQSLYWSSIAGGSESHQLLLRRRGDGIESPTTSNERLVANGQRLLTQPWRRLFQLSDDGASMNELTGAGQGSVQSLTSDGSRVFALGPYSTQALSITSSKIDFAGANTRLDVRSAAAMQLVLTDHASRVGGFEPRPRPLQQTVEAESLRLMQLHGAAGLGPLGELRLAGGPAVLLQRGDSLYQLRQVDVQGFRLREYPLSPKVGGRGTPLEPSLDVSFSIDAPAELITRGEVAFDVDPSTQEVVILESRTAGAEWPRSLLWLSLSEGKATILARQQRPAGPLALALRDHRLMLFDSLRATVCGATAGAIDELSSVDLPNLNALDVLALDGESRLYVSALNNQAELRNEVLVLGWEGPKLLSRFTVPMQAISVARVGHQLAFGTKGSIHLVEPTCGDVEPPVSTKWPLPNDGEPPRVDHCERLSTGCQEWSAPALPGDADRNGCVNSADATFVLNCFGQVVDLCKQSVLADLNGDGVVNDYSTVLQNLGKGCTATP